MSKDEYQIGSDIDSEKDSPQPLIEHLLKEITRQISGMSAESGMQRNFIRTIL